MSSTAPCRVQGLCNENSELKTFNLALRRRIMKPSGTARHSHFVCFCLHLYINSLYITLLTTRGLPDFQTRNGAEYAFPGDIFHLGTRKFRSAGNGRMVASYDLCRSRLLLRKQRARSSERESS